MQHIFDITHAITAALLFDIPPPLRASTGDINIIIIINMALVVHRCTQQAHIIIKMKHSTNALNKPI